jgi:ABC-type antimicrobial peptide transport system permease subunit
MGIVLRQAMSMVMIGAVLGMIGALGLNRMLRRFLYGFSPMDPFTFAMVTIGLSLIALLACWMPARRAARVNLMVALRHE